MKKLTIVGVGMGDERLFTALAKDKIARSQRLLAVGALSARLAAAPVCCPLSDLITLLETEKNMDTAVLVSGDAGFFSVSKIISEKLQSHYDIEIVNGLNSLQYFCGKLDRPYDSVEVVSMHGRQNNIIAKVSYHPEIFVLTGGDNKVHKICEQLTAAGLGDVNVFIGENLSYPEERILQGPARQFPEMEFTDLAVMLIENPAFAPKNMPLADEDFIRGDVPMTKEEVRQVILSKLKISQDDILWDIGAGTGSVSVEMARRAWNGTVYAVEHNEDACDLIAQNRIKHGAHNVQLICGEASEAVGSLPPPDKVFIGGSSGNMKQIISKILKSNPFSRIVVTAVTLQTLNEGIEKLPGTEILDIVCLNVAKAKKMGRYDMMTAQNPIYIITLQGKPEN